MASLFLPALPDGFEPVFGLFQQRIAHAVSQRLGVDFRAEALKTYAEAEAGVELIELTEAEKATWHTALQPALDGWIAARKAEGLPARAMIEEIRALEAKYQGLDADAIFTLTVEQLVAGLLP